MPQRARGRTERTVQLHAARYVHVSVYLAFGRAHLQDNRVVDPVAHSVRSERAIRDCGRKRKRGWIELRELEVEIDGVHIAGPHGRALETLPGRVGAGKIQTYMISHQEAHDRRINI